MSRRTVDHARLTPEQFSEALAALRMSPGEFSRLTGASRNTIDRALRPAGDHSYQEPPYWFTLVVGLLLLPGGPARARQLFRQHALSGQSADHHAGQSAV